MIKSGGGGGGGGGRLGKGQLPPIPAPMLGTPYRHINHTLTKDFLPKNPNSLTKATYLA